MGKKKLRLGGPWLSARRCMRMGSSPCTWLRSAGMILCRSTPHAWHCRASPSCLTAWPRVLGRGRFGSWAASRGSVSRSTASRGCASNAAGRMAASPRGACTFGRAHPAWAKVVTFPPSPEGRGGSLDIDGEARSSAPPKILALDRACSPACSKAVA